MKNKIKINEKGIELIKHFEGFRSEPYRCPAGVPTIGYGCTVYPDGTHVRMSDPPIHKNLATSLLKSQLRRYENGVNRYVKSDINQNQFDALVSFAYNLGLGNLKSSTLLKKVNKDPKDPTIADEFKRWVHCNGEILNGLKERRCKEAELYFS